MSVRIRSTKPEFWKSRRIASVPWDARLVLKGLESYVDDNGVGVDDIELIVTDIFPRDMFANGSETVARVSEAISLLHQAGLVWRYEANGDRLLYISFWEDTQRIDKPGKGRKPRPDGTFEYKSSVIRESVASPPETLAPGTGEQGNRGTGEQGGSGADAPPSPFCKRHREAGGTDAPCNGCKAAAAKFNKWLADQESELVDVPEWHGEHVHRWLADGSCVGCEEMQDAA